MNLPTLRDQPGPLAVNVVGKGVVGDRQPAVALRIPIDQALRLDRIAMDSDPLRGHRHVSEAIIDSERIAESEIVSRTYISPLDDDRAVERFRIRRTPSEDARFVRRGGRRLHRPASVLSERTDRSEPQGFAGDEVLFLHVAEGAYVPVEGAKGPSVPSAANWAGDGGAGCPKNGLECGRRKTSHARGGHRTAESRGCSRYQRPSSRHCLPPLAG